MFVPTIKTKSIVVAFAAAATLIAATPAFAETFVSNGRTVEVRYGDLDLTQADGRAALQTRLRKAATRVCVTSDVREQQLCRAKTLDNIRQPIAAVIASAEARARYADATPAYTKVVFGN